LHIQHNFLLYNIFFNHAYKNFYSPNLYKWLKLIVEACKQKHSHIAIPHEGVILASAILFLPQCWLNSDVLVVNKIVCLVKLKAQKDLIVKLIVLLSLAQIPKSLVSQGRLKSRANIKSNAMNI